MFSDFACYAAPVGASKRFSAEWCGAEATADEVVAYPRDLLRAFALASVAVAGQA